MGSRWRVRVRLPLALGGGISRCVARSVVDYFLLRTCHILLMPYHALMHLVGIITMALPHSISNTYISPALPRSLKRRSPPHSTRSPERTAEPSARMDDALVAPLELSVQVLRQHDIVSMDVILPGHEVVRSAC